MRKNHLRDFQNAQQIASETDVTEITKLPVEAVSLMKHYKLSELEAALAEATTRIRTLPKSA